MEEISEEHYCAGWMYGLEFDLWKIISEFPHGRRGYGLSDVNVEDIFLMLHLSRLTDGWWYWDDKLKDRRFVSLSEWENIRNG